MPLFLSAVLAGFSGFPLWFGQSAGELGVVPGDRGEQIHAGAELYVVGRAEDFIDAAVLDPIHKACTFAEPGTEHRVPEVGFRFCLARDAVFRGHGTLAESAHLGKHEPHPVGPLAPAAQFGADLAVEGVLGFDEAVQIERIGRCGGHLR